MDIFHEVDEDIRTERMVRFWRRIRVPLVSLAVLILAGTAGWSFWEYRAREEAQRFGHLYEAALELATKGKAQEAQESLTALLPQSPPGYHILIRFRLAALQALQDPAKAASLYEDLSQDPALDLSLRDMARLRAALLVSDHIAYADLKARVLPLAGPTQAFRSPARELLALSALQHHHPQEAVQWLEDMIKDINTAEENKRRAEIWLSLAQTDLANLKEKGEAP